MSDKLGLGEYEKNDVIDSSVVPASYENEIEFGGERKQTHRQLKPRHVQLIAISGAIGTGLFVSAFSGTDGLRYYERGRQNDSRLTVS